jgi:predicted nucleotidyltransferase
MNTNDAKATAKKFADLVRQKYTVSNAFLFGSFAKNTANEGSDIDVCIVSPNFGTDYSAEEMELIRMAITIDSRISPVPYTPQDLQDRYSQLAYEITTHGVPV